MDLKKEKNDATKKKVMALSDDEHSAVTGGTMRKTWYAVLGGVSAGESGYLFMLDCVTESIPDAIQHSTRFPCRGFIQFECDGDAEEARTLVRAHLEDPSFGTRLSLTDLDAIYRQQQR